MDLYASVAFTVARQKICQQILDNLRCGPNPEQSNFSGLERARALADRIRIEQQPPAAYQQILALRG